MSKEIIPNDSKIILYSSDDGQIRVDVWFQGETVWLSQQLMADLFQTTKQNISLHIKNIYDEGELTSEATVKEFLTVQKEGNYITAQDAKIAKNYLSESELKQLNLIHLLINKQQKFW